MNENDYLQVAARMNSKAGGKKLKSGDTVEYVICDDGSGLAATQRAYHVDEVRERNDLKVRSSCKLNCGFPSRDISLIHFSRSTASTTSRSSCTLSSRG